MRYFLLLPLVSLGLGGCVNVQKDPTPASTTTYVAPAPPSTAYVAPSGPYAQPSATTVIRNP
jgi:hypothetical protein